MIVSLLFRCLLASGFPPFPSLLEIELQESSGPGSVFLWGVRFTRIRSDKNCENHIAGTISYSTCRHKQLAYFCSWSGGYSCI